VTAPQSPGRPEHDDFWLISQALIDQDAAAASGQPFTELAGRYIDLESALYVARQRAQRSLVISRLPITAASLTRMAGLWIDGFLAGMAVQNLKHRVGQRACSVCGSGVFTLVQPGRWACVECGAHSTDQEMP
jgi:ribosomal protein S27AE